MKLSTEEEGLLRHWLIAPEAFDLAESLLEVFDLWDDLVDMDKSWPAVDRVDRVFQTALIGLWRNPIWRTHADVLVPVLEHVVWDWQDSNLFEERLEFHKAYVLRTGYVQLLARIAAIMGGPQWGRNAMHAFREHVLDDWDAYLEDTQDGMLRRGRGRVVDTEGDGAREGVSGEGGSGVERLPGAVPPS